jgi:hypothetical protein
VRKQAGLVLALLLAPAASMAPLRASGSAPDPAVSGAWSAPFQEDPGNLQYPIPADSANPGSSTEHCKQAPGGPSGSQLVCKPAAVNVNVLPDGRVLYWDGLAGFENIQHSTVLEAGAVSQDSQSRVLTLGAGGPSWITPMPGDGGGTNPDQNQGPIYPLPGNNGGGPLAQYDTQAQGDMFCSDTVSLADGRVLIAGGTSWYESPYVPGTDLGVAELQGLRTARIFDPRSNTYSAAQPMNYGRWYPALVELGDGRVFVGGGVRKLIQTDGTNVENTEVFSPATGAWTDNGPGGKQALPLFPRLTLLPNGSVYYSGAGQMWGPAGESLDEALYAMRSAWNPTTNTWSDYGFGTLGARSGSFSTLLTLHAPYTSADILVGGGTLGVPPASYLANNLTEIQHLDAAGGWKPTFALGPQLGQARWYSTAVTLPNEAVAVFSGANKDEVVAPGSESPVHMAEWYTPWDNSFHDLSAGLRDRTYHNTAVLLPDGSVLVAGHSPISAGYGNPSNAVRDATAGTAGATGNNFRDPSFEIFYPPYLFHGARPMIEAAPRGIGYGGSFHLEVDNPRQVSSVKLIRLPSETHEVDPNMRSVDLPFRLGEDGRLTVQAPPSGSVAPAGPYYLFVNRGSGAAAVPSKAAVVLVGHADASPAPIPSGPSDGIPLGLGGLVPQAPGASLAPVAPAGQAPPGLLGHLVMLLSGGLAVRLS